MPPSEAHNVEADQDIDEAQVASVKVTTPLPWTQLIVVLLMRLAEPVAFSLIFPFIGDMIWDLGATEDRGDVGMYAGIVESLFAAVQTLTVLQWGRASDKVGRKPIILNGLIGSSISTILLGLSTSFPMLIVARCLSGALNGNVAIFKSVIGELTDRTNSARAFSFLPLIWALGCTIGPLLGGYLSQPAKKYPALFSTGQQGALALNGLWEHYPYFMPCIVSATVTWFSIGLGIFFLEETLPSKVAQKEEMARQGSGQATEQTPLLTEPSNSASYESTLMGQGSFSSSSRGALKSSISNVPSQSSATRPPVFARPSRKRTRVSLGGVQSWTSGFTPTQSRANSPTPRGDPNHRPASPSPAGGAPNGDSSEHKDEGVLGLLRISHIRRIMLSYAFLSLTSVALDSVQVLYFWEPISLGGLSFPSEITGTFLSTAGSFAVLLQLFAFPFLQRRIGTLPLYKICLAAFPLVPIIMPLANWAARAGLKGEEHEGGFETDVEQSYRILVCALVAAAMSMKTIAVMAFSCNIILVNQASALAPGAQLGTLNGLAQMSSSLMRALGPYGASTLFALTLTEHLAGGYLIWIVLFAVGLAGFVATSGLADVERMIDRGEIDEAAANPQG